MSRQIYVGRLSSRIRRESLQQEFEKFGKIKDIDLRNTHAFIEFESNDDARVAIEKMDNKRLADGSDRITKKQMDEIEKMIDRKEQEDPHPETYVSIAAVRDIGLTNAKKVCAFGNTPGDLRDTCYRCFKKGHVRKDCTRSRTPSDRRKSRRDKDKRRRRSSSSSSRSSGSSRSRRRYRQQQKQSKRPNRRSPSSSGSRSKQSVSSQSSSKRP